MCKIAVGICTLLYFLLIVSLNLYHIADNLCGIAIRGVASVCGCVCLAVLCTGIPTNLLFTRALQWVGRNSIGIYLSHNLLLCWIKTESLPAMTSVEGIALVTVNFALTMLLSVGVTKVLNIHPFASRVFLGK